MVTVDPLALTPSQPVRGDVFGALRNGAVVQARVVAMLEANLARLAILGQTIDVGTPVALKAGTTLAVGVDNTGGALKLIIQADAAQAPKAASLPIFSSAMGSSMSAALVAITDALLSAESKAAASSQAPSEPAPPPSDAASERLAAAQLQPQAQTSARADMAMTPSSLTAGAQHLAPPALPHFAQEAQAAAAYSHAFLSAPAQNPAQAVAIPFQLPHMAYPIEVLVERQDEDEESGDGSQEPAGRSWRVGLSMDAGAMGLVHIGVGFRAGAVSVTLAAGEAQAAAQLRAWLPELKTALENADLTVDELSAQQGIAVYDRPSQTRSITL